jgi:hypothetical protein
LCLFLRSCNFGKESERGEREGGQGGREEQGVGDETESAFDRAAWPDLMPFAISTMQ